MPTVFVRLWSSLIWLIKKIYCRSFPFALYDSILEPQHVFCRKRHMGVVLYANRWSHCTASMPKHAIKETVRCPFAQASNGKWLRWEQLDQQQWSDAGNPEAKTLSKPPGNIAVQKAATQVLMVTIITKPLNLSSENYDHRERLLYWLFFLY